MSFGDIIRWILSVIFGFIDALVYWLGAELYDLMMDIASAEVFKQETIMTVAERVYQLLGLIMLFKLIFSFLTYVINPDEMTDKTKGMGNIIKKVIITLILIVITPWGFEQSRNLQTYIIEDKVIEYFVFGQVKPTNASAGYNLMHTVGTMFVTPYKCVDAACTANNNPGELCGADWYENIPYYDSTTKTVSNGLNKCGYGMGSNSKFAQEMVNAEKVDGVDDKTNIFSLMQLGATGTRNKEFLWFEIPTELVVSHQVIISTAVGVAIVYMLLVMCIDVALRSIKLAFYEIISPVPIISYIGMKDGKDTMLNKWFGEVVKTYADLFTRIAGLQLAVFFINEIVDDGIHVNGDGLWNTIFVNLFLIFGALTFAKELPKILEGMGIKFSGGGFNLKKKFTDNMVGGQKLWAAGKGMTLGMAGGMAANAIKGGANMWKAHKANQELRKQMKAEGFTSFGKKERRSFYDSHYGDSNYMDLGSARNRRQYARHDARYAHSVAHSGDTGLKKLWSSTVGMAAAHVGAHNKFTNDHASDFGGGLGSIVAGGVSAAVHTTTSKDGSVSAGIKSAVDNRDLRDKRQGAGYGFGKRMGDSILSYGGVDTALKGMEKANFDELNELQLQISATEKRYTEAVHARNVSEQNAAKAEYQKLQAALKKKENEISALKAVKDKK